MKFYKFLYLLTFLVSTTVLATTEVYFNHRAGFSYQDPYFGYQHEGQNLEEVVLRNIETAQNSIWIAVQEIRLPLIAKKLVEKKQQGVDIRIIVEHDYNNDLKHLPDNVPGSSGYGESETEYEANRIEELVHFADLNGSGKLSYEEQQARDAIYILNKGGIPIRDDRSDESNGSGLMHHKFIIIDGQTVIVSSANLTPSCIHGDKTNLESRGNANGMVVFHSQEMNDVFRREFAQMWGVEKSFARFGVAKEYRGPQVVQADNTHATVQFSPTSRKLSYAQSTNGLISLTLQKARESIHGALFVFSDQKIANAIQVANDLGAKIGFVGESKFIFRSYSEFLDMLGVGIRNQKCEYEVDNNPFKKPLTEVGAIRLSQGDLLHHKFAVVDSNKVIFGSHNWSESANSQNDETLVVIEDQEVAKAFKEQYDFLLSKTTLGLPGTILQTIENQGRACFSSL